MALSRVTFSFNCSRILRCNFSSSSILNNYWRRSQGLEIDVNKYGPLARLPDYSFVDGRPTPLTLKQKNNLVLQQKYCKRIVELCHEIDVGLENYYKKQEEIKRNREALIKNKLKPKGKALLKKNDKK